MFDCLKSKVRRSQLGYGSAPIIPTPQPPAAGWQIGPVINGQNYSKLMPASTPDGGFEFPVAPGSVNYIFRPATSPILRIEYEITGGQVQPEEVPEGEATIALYFVCSDNNWSNDGGRWWTRARGSVAEGRHEFSAALDPSSWVTVQNDRPDLFAPALTRIVAAGYTFGGPDGAGHGVRALATGCRFTLIGVG